MSWRDRIGDGVAVFRGVTLYLERGSISPGRRVQVHEYPLRDEPYVEDLGRKARPWQITGYLLGEDYDVERNQLADALELPGAFEMRHSYYGTHRVVLIDDPRITETTREGGMARVSFTVLRADDAPRYPLAVADTQQVVGAAAESSRLAILDEFVAAYEIVELAVDRVEAIEATILGAISEIEGIIGGVTGTISRLIRTPAELGAAILSSIGQIKNLFGEPGRALGVYRAMFGTDNGEVASVPPSAPAPQAIQIRAQNAAVALVRRAAAIELAAASAEWRYPTREAASETLEAVHLGITEQISGSVPPLPQTTQRLVSLRAAAVQDLRRRGTALPSLKYYTPGARLPALVLAHRLYGDARRDGDIISRNRVRHPGDVPADRLEVLSE
jgi:prophage DNA circulation protein